jgi:hypothetical protein
MSTNMIWWIGFGINLVILTVDIYVVLSRRKNIKKDF